MAIQQPYRRTARQLKDGSYSNSGNSRYIKHSEYASSPEKYIRSFLIIQNDLQKIFEYVEPSDKNKRTYSYRIHELFIRVCIEVEANCKAILRENGYSKKQEKDWNMHDYCLIEKTHQLSSYEVSLPRWDTNKGLGLDRYCPFKNWGKENLNWYQYYREYKGEDKSEIKSWYQYYNETKHDIHSKFEHANLKNLVEATSGLVALLSAQFLNEDFSYQEGSLIVEGIGDGMDPAVGSYFRVKYPDWTSAERYDFEWGKIKDIPGVIKCHDYNSL